MKRTVKPSLGDMTGLGEMTWILGRNDRAGKASPGNTRAKLLVASIVAAVGFLTWTMLSGPIDAEIQPVSARPAAIGLAQDTSLSDPAMTPTQATLAAPADENAPAEPAAAEIAPVDGLKISSQSWRRGGLGSNALVTLTLRNRNDFAVKDIEISCTFTRSDGSHLTDRTRVIPDTINTRSRKTFARLHVGFVNVNASKAICALVAASHV
jgi:hypothetical protein